MSGDDTRATTTGTVGGTAINPAAIAMGHDHATKVQLSGNYVRSIPPGWPSAPQFTGAEPSKLDYPRTITSGTQLILHANEAAALIAAGKATKVADV